MSKTTNIRLHLYQSNSFKATDTTQHKTPFVLLPPKLQDSWKTVLSLECVFHKFCLNHILCQLLFSEDLHLLGYELHLRYVRKFQIGQL